MTKLRFVVSLSTKDNDYQLEQAASAEEASHRLGIDIEVLYAENDAINQSQQLLKIIQGPTTQHPNGIIFEPAGGTALPQVGRAAVAAGISWVVMNRESDYIADLRRSFRVPVFSVTSNHEEIGRIQGRQMAALLPKGGSILFIEGPAEHFAAKSRLVGLSETKPANVQLKAIRGQWTDVSAQKAITSWLRLSTSRQSHMDVVAAQNDQMAVGARKAFQELVDAKMRDRWLNIPYIGVDGVSKTGQAWVKSGLLTATVIAPAMAGQCMEMLMRALQNGMTPPEKTYTVPLSYPSLDELERSRAEKARIMSV
jgi:ribose transport system substrate-binding protein